MAELRTPQGHTLLLPEGNVSVGADPSNEVPVAAHLGLAPVHFRLQPWEGGHFLEDAGSGLGTLVNGHPVNWKPLTAGDVIVAGELEVIYAQQAKSPSSPVPVIMAPAPPAGLMAAFPPPPLPHVETAPSRVPPPPPQQIPPAVPPLAALITFPPPMLGPAAPGASPVPPAWLPADLLPESYSALEPEPASAPVRDHASRLTPASPRGATRRLLRWAAIIALLAGAGHLAWQQGHLKPLIHSLRELTKQILHPTPAPTAKPAVNAPASLPTATTPSGPPAADLAPAQVPVPQGPSGAQITTQIGR